MHLKNIFLYAFENDENILIHGKKVITQLNNIIYQLHDQEKVLSYCNYVGNKHKHIDILPSNFDVIFYINIKLLKGF